MHFAMQAASDPAVQEAAARIGRTGAQAAAGAVKAATNWEQDTTDDDDKICAEKWKALVLVLSVCILLLCISGLLCCCGGLAGGGFGWVAASGRSHDRRGGVVSRVLGEARAHRAEEVLALDALAREVLEGDLGLRRRAAREVGVDVAALEEWAATWIRAMRGPRRP